MKVSAIICAYNEADRIGKVISAAVANPNIAEIIVVDDGSSDGTHEKAKHPNVRVIRHPENRGKSAAIATGVKNANHPLLLFLDADLDGITPRDLARLLEPVLENRADVAMSIRKNSSLPCHFIGVDFLSGERVVPKSVFDGVLDTVERLPSFGIEVFMNQQIIKKKLRIAPVYLHGVTAVSKFEKRGGIRGIVEDVKMYGDVFKVTPLDEVLYQNYALSLLAKREFPELVELKKTVLKRLTRLRDTLPLERLGL